MNSMIDHHPDHGISDRLDRIEDAMTLLAEKYSDERFGRLSDSINSLSALLTQRADAADLALSVAKTSLNEMRGMAVDQQVNFLTKAEYAGKHELLSSKMESLEKLSLTTTIPRNEYNQKHDAILNRIDSVERQILEIKSLARGANWAAIGLGTIASAVVSWVISVYVFHQH